MGLLLLGGSLWRLASIVTAFTAGHSITLSIVVVGADNLLMLPPQREPNSPLSNPQV